MSKFDCRHIDAGKVCEYLRPWEKSNSHMQDLAPICSCMALNRVIFPEFKNKGSIKQKLDKVEPIFQCPKMQQARIEGVAPLIMGSINKKTFETWNDE